MSGDEFEARVGTWVRRKWKLERLLGLGGMAAVYVGRHKIGRVAAIKLLRHEIAADPEVRRRFEQEARAVNSIDHEGVVKILDLDEDDDGTDYLVMELLEGETLADRVERQGRPKLTALLDYVDQTLDVLVACHRKGVIHRDIKPENLFVQTNGRLKVLDFGIARMREGVETLAGTMLGTPAFMPAEQLRGGAVDARVDLYALGATMFTVLSGRRVHRAKNDAELAAKILSEPAPPLCSVADDLPEHLGWVVDRALAYLADRRYPDAQTMRGDVWALQRGGRPPYANACREAGLRSDVTSLEPPPKKTRPEGGATVGLPSTDPQLPVFTRELPTTDPQLPAFVATKASKAPQASHAEGATTSGAGAEPAGELGIALEPTASDVAVLDDQQEELDEERGDEERGDEEEGDEERGDEDAEEAAERSRAPRARTLVGFPRRGAHEAAAAEVSDDPDADEEHPQKEAPPPASEPPAPSSAGPSATSAIGDADDSRWRRAALGAAVVGLLVAGAWAAGWLPF